MFGIPLNVAFGKKETVRQNVIGGAMETVKRGTKSVEEKEKKKKKGGITCQEIEYQNKGWKKRKTAGCVTERNGRHSILGVYGGKEKQDSKAQEGICA